ncbi:MAG: SRPBCC domain-containing protein [Acidimicrobiia bacterium]
MTTRELKLEQLVSAPPSTVYRYLTESGKWAMWQGERASIDARPGGRFSMDMANGMTAEGEFVELVPNVRVVFTWGWVNHPDLPPGSTTVEIVLSEVRTGTRVILTQRQLPEAEWHTHQVGWRHYLPRLATVAAGGEPGPDPGPGPGS